MDIQRPSNARAKKIKRILYVIVSVVVIAGVTLGLSRLKPAAPSVDRGTVWTDTVKRGPMLREVRGLGTLVPLDIHWIRRANRPLASTRSSFARTISSA